MPNGQHSGFHKWSIAWICSFVNFLYLGVPRLSGMLYLAAITRYNVSRDQASLPFVLCYTMRNVTGPFIGYLSKKVEVQKIIASGCVISAIGVGACFFAESITTVTILWGGFFGLGVGFCTILIPCVLNQHFDKYITNANGIAFGGECIAGFILPPIFEFCLSTYGTSGSFLILSGLVLHGVPAAMLLKPPKRSLKSDEESSLQIADTNCQSNATLETDSSNEIHSRESYLRKENFTESKSITLLTGDNENSLNVRDELEKQSEAETSRSVTHRKNKHDNALLNKRTVSPILTKDSILNSGHTSQTNTPEAVDSNDPLIDSNLEQFECSDDFHDTIRSLTPNPYQNTNIPSNSMNVNQGVFEAQPTEHSLPKHHQGIVDYEYSLPSSSTGLHSRDKNSSKYDPVYNISASQVVSTVNQRLKERGSFHRTSSSDDFCDHSIERINSDGYTSLQTDPSTIPKKQKNAFRVFLDPAFLLMLLTQSSMIFIATTFTTIIVDFSKDIGVTDKQSVYVLMCYSIADMLGRFCLGWVTDGGYLSNVAFSSLCYGVMGAILVAVVSFRGFVLAMVAVFVFGLFLGGLIIIGPGVVSTHLEEDKINIALASRFCLFGPMSLTQSPMIGYFRDTLGSYNGIFYLLGVHCLACTVLSLLIPFASRSRGR